MCASSTVNLLVEGEDGFTLRGASSMRQISRDPLDLVTAAMGRYHQYPDGMVLFLGTMFAPTEDRGQPGSGFTHKVGDIVRISSAKLGTLVNRVDHCDRITPWTFGLRALLAQAGGAAGRFRLRKKEGPRWRIDMEKPHSLRPARRVFRRRQSSSSMGERDGETIPHEPGGAEEGLPAWSFSGSLRRGIS
jgi:hypothetical protein